jgi:cytochrome c556
MRSFRLPPAALLAAAASSIALAAGAQPELGADEGAIQYRQKVMSAVGADMGAIGDIMKYGLPFQSAVVAHAQSLSKHADLAAAAFERKVVEGPTDAKPEVWEKPDLFLEKLRAMKAKADELAEVAADSEATPAQIGTRVKALGDSCGNCHESFRKPKEESYKRASAE